MRPILSLTLLATLAACSTATVAPEPGICAAWSAPERVGAIDVVALKEASGLAVSRAIPSRLYHHNDSGMGPKFFLTDAAGGNLQTVEMPSYKPVDIEDMSIGPCGDGRRCLVFGDIGDNGSVRPSISFVVVPEKETFAATEAPLRVVNARYPDGPHNSEGFAFHPNGDLYLLTKVARRPAQVFRLSRAQMAVTDGSMQTFEQVGEIDVSALMAAPGAAPPSVQVTAFDISPDGKRALILVYQGAVEIGFDLAKPLPPQAEWREGVDYRRIELTRLLQMEAIAYSADGKSFFYDSETPVGSESVLYRQRCEAAG